MIPEKDKLINKINKFKFYHKIKVKDNLYTKGDEGLIQFQKVPLSVLRKYNLKNKKVLDIGCRDGLFSFEAEKLGANYLQFGSVFTTKSHPTIKPLGIKELKKITSKVKIPIVAVGGINEKNCLIPLKNGAKGIASIRSFSDQKLSKKILAKLNDGEILC